MTETVAAGQLRALIERIERVEAEIKGLNADKSEIYKEARGVGFDVKAIRQCVSARKLDSAEREERDAIFDLYWSALGGTSHVHVHVEHQIPAQDGRGTATGESPSGKPKAAQRASGQEPADAALNDGTPAGQTGIEVVTAGETATQFIETPVPEPSQASDTAGAIPAAPAPLLPDRATPGADGQPFVTRKITCGSTEYTVLVDAEDEHFLDDSRWIAEKNRNTFYLRVSSGHESPEGRPYLHRLICGSPDDVEIDHRNSNGLDNRKSNLREATRQQNSANRAKGNYPNATSKFKGVCEKAPDRWAAQITVNNQNRHLGTFHSEEEAARSYDAAAVEAFGEFARVNFPGQAAPIPNDDVPAFLLKDRQPLRPLCLNPAECAGYGSKTCHRCLAAAGRSEVAA